MDQQGRKDLEALLGLLPEDIYKQIQDQGREEDLLEVVMDLGRRPPHATPKGKWFCAIKKYPKKK